MFEEIIQYDIMTYTGKDFFHENTVAFAGSIVPKVKRLQSKEKEYWDKFEWDW